MTGIPMKTVVALSKQYDTQLAVQLNAVGHLSQAIGRAVHDLAVAEYHTADGASLGSLGWWPLIILSGRATKVEQLWQSVRGGYPAACFLETMIQGGSEAQLAATAALHGDELPIVAMAVHAPVAELDTLTRKLSLWRPSSTT